jgi:diamine N-acetyltransferase
MEKVEKLVGKFVNLRALMVDDAKITHAWRNAQRAQYLNRGVSTVEDQARWIAHRPKEDYDFIIELKDSTPVGMLSLTNIDLINKNAEPGRFLIGNENACKGIPAAAEAMKLLYQLAFENLGLVRVCGIVAANNSLMIKWQKYMGMKEEGRLRNHLYQDGKFFDAVYLALLVEEYRSVSLPKLNAFIKITKVD